MEKLQKQQHRWLFVLYNVNNNCGSLLPLFTSPKSIRMKILLLNFFFIVSFSLARAQITTPIVKAGFGVDADLKANFFNGFGQSGNDDWFSHPSNIGTGRYVIDTTG